MTFIGRRAKLGVFSVADFGNVLIVIPARGGSKRLPRKNVLPLGGKPLIAWTIEAALESRVVGRIVVSSDDSEILEIAQEYAARGVVAYRRPDELGSDLANTADVVLDTIEAQKRVGYPADTVVLLQPTSPLRTGADIAEALKLYQQEPSGRSLVSVCEVDHPTAWTGTIDQDNTLRGLDLSVKRSQDYQKEYRLNGALYVASVQTLLESGSLFTDELKAYVMPRSRSVDIDEREDFDFCSVLVSSGTQH